MGDGGVCIFRVADAYNKKHIPHEVLLKWSAFCNCVCEKWIKVKKCSLITIVNICACGSWK